MVDVGHSVIFLVLVSVLFLVLVLVSAWLPLCESGLLAFSRG